MEKNFMCSSSCKNDISKSSIKMNVFGNNLNYPEAKRYVQLPYPVKPNIEPIQFNPKSIKIPHLLNG
jgi:hypothetical protein